MIKKILVALILVCSLWFLVTFVYAQQQESITITTYYPSPYGVYKELTTTDNTYLATQGGNVGIGTTNPGAKLDVAGRIWQTGTGKSVFLGEGAGASDDLSDNQNVFVGYQAGYSNTIGIYNVAVGDFALYYNTTGWNNIALGRSALYSNTTGSSNIAIGLHAGDNITSGSQNIIIGYNVYAPSATADHQLNIGNVIFGTGLTGTGSTIAGNVGVGTANPNAKLQINGAISRQGTTLYGNVASTATHVNLGVNSVTGQAGFNYSYATVGGGSYNTASSTFATVGGGSHNTVNGGYSTVGGGLHNNANGNYATIGGGRNNFAQGDVATVGGGLVNSSRGVYATVGGGESNAASGKYATIGGGYNNAASDWYATVGGGWYNTASDDSATIGGGDHNTASGQSSTVGGGYYNTASGYIATVGGGTYNTASGDYSWAGGRRAKAVHKGSFVWADSTDADYFSNGDNTFNIRAGGGVYYGGSQQWDIAEFMDVLESEKVREAEIVSIAGDDLLGKSKKSYDEDLVGVVSSSRTTSLHLGATNQELKGKLKKGITRLAVSLVGRVYVKVSKENGNIKLGDPITSSSLAGIGMKATSSGKVIGYALEEEDFKDKEISEILVFVNVGYYVNPKEYKDLLSEVKSLREELEKIKSKI